MARRLSLIMFLLLFGVYSYTSNSSVKRHDVGAGGVARMDFLHALFLQRTLSIDAFVHNTSDFAVFEGHAYNEKAPGLYVLALPAYAASLVAVGIAGHDVFAGWGFRLCLWITSAGSVALLTALSGVAFYQLLLHMLKDRRIALISTFAVYLGSPAYQQATQFMSHAVVFACIVFSLWALELPHTSRRSVRLRKRSGETREILVGLSLGFALASEFSAGVPVLATLAYAAWKWGGRRMVRVCLFAMPPLLLVLLNNWVTFGSPFTNSYSYAVSQVTHTAGFLGIEFPPHPDHLLAMLLDERHGLLPWSPFFVLAIVGLRNLYRYSVPLFWFCIIAFSLHLTFMGGFVLTHQTGDRFIVCALPMLALPASFGCARFRAAGDILAVVSLCLMNIVVMVNPWLKPLPRHSMLSNYLAHYFQGTQFPDTLNVGMQIGMDPLHSFLLPLLIVLAVFAVLLLASAEPLARAPR